MARVNIAIRPRPYEAIIEGGLLSRAGSVLREMHGPAKSPAVFVITVAAVRRWWGRQLMKSLVEAGFQAKFLTMPDGERHKRLATVEAVAEKLSRLGADRSCLIVAFGGGVVGDVAGLLASLYMRGVDVVQVPTTIVAQADASIGGKTGVNLRTGKNLIGTFHQPRMVLIDPAVLSTLPEREFRAGLYEVLKCGVIGNPELFAAFDNLDVRKLRRDPDRLQCLITEALRLKAKIVSADERETGLRRVLNFGHTIGHALEAESGYRRFLHGEAVAWGMVAAARISAEVGNCSAATATQIKDQVLALGKLPRISAGSQSLLRLLQSDKKTRNGVVHFVLPREIGEVEIVNDVPEAAILGAVNEIRRLSMRTR